MAYRLQFTSLNGMFWFFLFACFTQLSPPFVRLVSPLETCERTAEFKANSIILTRQAIRAGAEFLKQLTVNSLNDCYFACCHVTACTTAIFKSKVSCITFGLLWSCSIQVSKECFLFNCDRTNSCLYTSHENYDVVILSKTKRARSEDQHVGLGDACDQAIICTSEHTVCSDGHCVCQSGWLLKGSTCVRSVCKSPTLQFQCTEGSTCVAIYDRCNGIIECPDGSDEVGCSTTSATPSPRSSHSVSESGLSDANQSELALNNEWNASYLANRLSATSRTNPETGLVRTDSDGSRSHQRPRLDVPLPAIYGQSKAHNRRQPLFLGRNTARARSPRDWYNLAEEDWMDSPDRRSGGSPRFDDVASPHSYSPTRTGLRRRLASKPHSERDTSSRFPDSYLRSYDRPDLYGTLGEGEEDLGEAEDLFEPTRRQVPPYYSSYYAPGAVERRSERLTADEEQQQQQQEDPVHIPSRLRGRDRRQRLHWLRSGRGLSESDMLNWEPKRRSTRTRGRSAAMSTNSNDERKEISESSSHKSASYPQHASDHVKEKTPQTDKQLPSSTPVPPETVNEAAVLTVLQRSQTEGHTAALILAFSLGLVCCFIGLLVAEWRRRHRWPTWATRRRATGTASFPVFADRPSKLTAATVFRQRNPSARRGRPMQSSRELHESALDDDMDEGKALCDDGLVL